MSASYADRVRAADPQRRRQVRASAAFTAPLSLVVAVTVSACGTSPSSQSSSAPPASSTASTFSSPGDPSPVVLPLARISPAGTRPVINVSVAGGPTVPVLFDTGSTGLRIFADKVGSDGLKDLGKPTASTFSSGNHLEGRLASAPVVVAGIPTAGPIEFHKITSASCTASKPNCPSAGGEAAYIRNTRVVGVFGAGLRSGSAFSPLQQLQGPPVSSYSVTIAGNDMMVTLNPRAGTDIATFSMPRATPATHPNGAPAWLDQQVNGCWEVGDGPRTCVPTVFDTGASSTSIESSLPGAGSNPRSKPWSLASAVSAEPVWTVTDSRATPQRIRPHAGDSIVNTGVAIFQELDVVYDVVRGTVGLRYRSRE